MSGRDPGTQAGRRAAGEVRRGLSVWRDLPHERRLAAGAALGLFLTLFLPWYQETVIAGGSTGAPALRAASASITGWGAFSFVEAAVLLVASGVLVLLFTRGEGRAFHVPGGDGGVITAAGVWTCVLIIWRVFDKASGQTNHGQYLTSSGIEWGIFLALGVAGLLTYAGTRIRLAREPEPPLPGERRFGRCAGAEPGAVRRPPSTPRPVAAEPRSASSGDWGEEGSAGWSAAASLRSQRPRAPEAPTRQARADQAPTRQARADQAPTREGSGSSRNSGEAPAADQDPGVRRPRPLGLGEIELDDPAGARLGSVRPPTRPAPDPDPDDQLTIRIERPE